MEAQNHKVNVAEPAVKSAKYHTIAILCTIDPSFPVQLWDRVLSQLEATLNILQISRTYKGKSAYRALNGSKFNWNRTPLTILGANALTFLDPTTRRIWEPHAVNVFVVGFTPLHYRLLEFFNPQIGGCVITGTHKLYPAYCRIPTISEGDGMLILVTDLLEQFKKIVTCSAKQKATHCNTLRDLTNMI